MAEVEVLNEEYYPTPEGLLVNANLKAPHGGQVVGGVVADGSVVPPELYGVSYSMVDAFISVRGLPVDKDKQETTFTIALIDYVAPSPPELELQNG